MKNQRTVDPLLRSILDAAKAKGLNQKTVAERSDMAPESLSRIIRTGRMELGTIRKLAETVGLELFTGKAAEPPASDTSVATSH